MSRGFSARTKSIKPPKDREERKLKKLPLPFPCSGKAATPEREMSVPELIASAMEARARRTEFRPGRIGLGHRPDRCRRTA